MDFSRQKDIFNRDRFNLPVHIIGAGATGSWVALCLAKLGIENITVWDFDKVEEHNIPNQLFSVTHAKEGKLKVTALRHTISENTGIEINAQPLRVTGEQRLDGIVFLLTDTMSSRKEIYEKAIRYKPYIKLLIETRMGLSEGRIYTIDPIRPGQLKEYEGTFYGDEEAPVSACGTSQSVVTTAMTIASMAVRQMVNWFNEKPINHEIMLDLEYNQIYTRKFEE